jgi:two-component system cell cycle response regulator
METARILVIGDQAFSTDLSQQLQRCTNEPLLFADTSSTAIALIAVEKPPLIVIQASLKGSLEVCQHLRKHAELFWIYCILVVASDQVVVSSGAPATGMTPGIEDMATALEAGADAYLWMPTLETRCLLQAQIAVGLRQINAHRQLLEANLFLSELAWSDPLMGINNRKALDLQLPQKIQAARLQGQPLSLLMVDLDEFKTINDSYGHLVGDQVLKLVAARLRHNLRTDDIPYRYGGDEFVIVLNHTDFEEAVQVASRLCQIGSQNPLRVDDHLMLPITISVGVAVLTPEDDVIGMNLLERADRNLLEAKATGRNRVVSD